MSINNIKLPDITLQSLYKNTLIAEEKCKEVISVENTTSLHVLGKNKKNIAVIVENEDSLYMPDQELQFLTGILSACKLTLEDVAILNINKNPQLDYLAISEKMNSSLILLFGIHPAKIKLPLEFPEYQIQKYNNQTYLLAPALEALRGEKAEKLRLWNCLKHIFSIS